MANVKYQIETSEPYVGGIDKVPDKYRDNPNLLTGYRINCHSNKDILKSLFYAHNELVNVWSHFLAAVFVIFLLISMASIYPTLCTKANSGWLKEFKFLT